MMNADARSHRRGGHKSPLCLLLVAIVAISCFESWTTAFESTRPTRIPLLQRSVIGRMTIVANHHDGQTSAVALYAADKEKDDNDDEDAATTDSILGNMSESEQLQSELNKLTASDEDLPLFSFNFDASNVQESQLPIPLFTASLVFLWSILTTFYLYDIGINGFD